ncbi:MAG TPA: citrate:proton symporter [Sphingopyxis sp.]|uniref:CitMHS family transporter n=1 Tax=Sphingopyxis sp. TaxID=1908224 RepID=UPI002B5B0043|nr:citrate:proton symporter [Sphingopyxis sp.]HWW57540.1 citrate:proton symporter [Sphingopyxis sp.]
MLMLLGYLMVLTFMVLIMTKRMSALVALTVVPIVFGLLAGHGADLGAMAVDGISKLAPTATLLLFAVLYFAVMIDAGLFDPLVGRVLKFAGDDPVRVSLGTAILALVVALDGDGATTALITVTAFLPVYRRLGMNPLVLAVNLGSASCVMNLTPWGGPMGRAAAALHIDPSDIFVPLLPTWAAGIAGTLLIAWHLGRRERGRIAVEGTEVHGAGGPILFDRDETLRRPGLFYFNLALTLAILGAAISGIVPLPLVFMIGLSIALLVNYPKVSQQGERIQAHAENGLPIVLLILAAGSFTGVMQGTGMIDAMADGAVTLIPPELGPHIGVVTAFLAMPLTFVLSNDAFYFGVVPVIAETASHYQVAPEVIARASLLALPIHGLSPLIAAIYLLAGLIGKDVGEMQRFGLKWAFLLSLILIAAATLTGVIL